MIETIERAAVSARPEDITVKLRNAPAWVTARATAKSSKPAPRPAAPAKPAARRALPPVIGWVAGVCCPGVSRPVAFSHQDGETLPEQFTPAAMQRMLDQSQHVTSQGIPVTWNHGGPVIATTRSLDLLFRVDRTTGLEFEVRLRDDEIGRKVLADIDGGRSLGVSIGFDKTQSWIVERDGVGRVRVVDGCVLHHVAILSRSATLRPVYSGARCYGERDNGMACPSTLRRNAQAWAFRFIASQAGVRT